LNLTNFEKTSIPVVCNLIKSLADNFGVMKGGTELVEPVPMDALRDVVRTCLQVHRFEIDQIIESHLLDRTDSIRSGIDQLALIADIGQSLCEGWVKNAKDWIISISVEDDSNERSLEHQLG